MELSPAQWRTLRAACDTLIPAAPAGPAASDLGVPEQLLEALAAAGRPADLTEFRQFLALLGLPSVGLVAAGRWGGLADLPASGREELLRWLARSPVPQLRKGFQALKGLTAFLYAAVTDDAGRNPGWAALGYPGAPDPAAAPPHRPHPIAAETIAADTELAVDAVIIGSGAGGGVAAAELARRGLQVVVLEQGPLPPPAELGGPELTGMRTLYMDQGTLASRDLGVVILAGACAGGGTTVNWTACIAPPPRLRDEWEREHGLSGLTGPDFATGIEDVLARLGVTLDYSATAPHQTAARLLNGCRSLGYAAAWVPRNVAGCGPDCGACCFGCRSGAKLGTVRTYLADACTAGARLITGCRVDRVLLSAGRAAGVAARCGPHRLTVRAPRVVVAAGAIGSPALLLRSGLDNPHIGRHLHLHPTAATAGFYAEPVDPWSGRLLSAYSYQFIDPETGYGFLLELAPGHPGLALLATPWTSGARFRELAGRARHLAPFIAVVRDRGSGRVTVDSAGRHRIDYRLDPEDRPAVLRSIREMVRVHAAAGARHILVSHADDVSLDLAGDGSDWPRVDRFTAGLERLDTRPNRLAVFSAHQMGTCRLGASRRTAVADPRGQVYGVPGLYICDASGFPSAAGVNPMITVMSLATWISRQIA